MPRGFSPFDSAGRMDPIAVAGAGATGVVPGSTTNLSVVCRPIAQCVVTGTIATLTVVLEGSLDNINWVSLATSSVTTGTYLLSGPSNTPVLFVRLNITAYTGTGTVASTFASVPA